MGVALFELQEVVEGGVELVVEGGDVAAEEFDGPGGSGGEAIQARKLDR